ncbi:unnamed protein product [Lupinus luteus]|uniref:Uncharacterized protein n=1 Tax=Lupinus luteus TaxID=3873 RepID=A0AAV1W8K5_LUPLU
MAVMDLMGSSVKEAIRDVPFTFTGDGHDAKLLVAPPLSWCLHCVRPRSEMNHRHKSHVVLDA